jgi:hypothetical protein
MGIDAHFLHRCAIQRPAVTGQDAYNNDVTQTATAAAGIPCRLVMKTQAILSDDRVQRVAVTRYMLLLPAGTDVREGDKVIDLVLEDGTRQSPFRVKAILPRRGQTMHHVTLELERVI